MTARDPDLNPQAEQMADESMIRTLDTQARAIWPQEIVLIDRYALPPAPRILDAGCGTGEAASRLAEHFPQAQVLGVDVVDQSLMLARSRFASLAPRLSFERRSVFGLELPAQSFDLTVCRHVLHLIPHPEQAIAELVRVTRPGGYLHLIAEDYGMMHFESNGPDLQKFWHAVSDRFTAATQTDMYAGRHIFGILTAAGLESITIEYVVVDTLRVPRPLFAAMLESWRDGFANLVAELMSVPLAAVLGHFENMIEQVRDPRRYAVWMVPVVSARVPMGYPADAKPLRSTPAL
jgi:ubiquinone/menaquinone biosynthesis C-methylase UbiE